MFTYPSNPQVYKSFKEFPSSAHWLVKPFQWSRCRQDIGYKLRWLQNERKESWPSIVRLNTLLLLRIYAYRIYSNKKAKTSKGNSTSEHQEHLKYTNINQVANSKLYQFLSKLLGMLIRPHHVSTFLCHCMPLSLLHIQRKLKTGIKIKIS